MVLKDFNFNANIIEENDSALTRNKSSFTLNLNPYVLDHRSQQKIDSGSLEYLKDISKSQTLVNRNEEDEGNSAFTGRKFLTNDKQSRKRRSMVKSKVTFRDILVEPEERKGIFY